MHVLIYSTSILTAFLGGALALFAPCCIVSLGPTYLAAVFSVPRRHLLDRTGVFALGVAVVLLPVVLGLGAIGVALNQAHREVFFLGGVLMLLMGLSAFAGRGWSLPMPMMRGPSMDRGGVANMFLLGTFSGVVSSCCAPVLGGVMVLSVTAGSIAHATALGVAYVVGMVTPLFLAALLWNAAHLERKGLFTGRTLAVTVAGRRLVRPIPDLGAGILFFAMGGLMVGLAVTNRGTYTPDFLRDLNRWASNEFAMLAGRAGSVPEWLFAVGIAALLGGLAALAWPRGGVAEGRLVGDDQSPPADAWPSIGPACHAMTAEPERDVASMVR